jgi:hypothetical protein
MKRTDHRNRAWTNAKEQLHNRYVESVGRKKWSLRVAAYPTFAWVFFLNMWRNHKYKWNLSKE